MAENPLNPRDAKQVNEELGFVEDALLSIAATLSNTIQEAIEDIKDSSKGVAEILKDQVGKSVKNLARDLNKTAENTEKIAKGTLKRADIDKQITARLLKKQAITRNLNTLAKTSALSEENKLKAINEINEAEKAHSALLQDQLKIAIKTQKNMGITGRLIKGISKIPILGDLIDAGDVLAKTTAAAAEEGATKLSTAKAGGKALLDSAKSLGPAAGLGIAVTLLKKFIEASFKADAQVTKLGKSLSLSKEAARGLRNNLTSSKGNIDSIYKDTQSLVDAMTQLAELSEFTSIASIEQVDAQLQLTKQLGLSVEEANELQGLFKVNTEGAIEGKKAIFDQVAAFTNQTGLLADTSKIMKQITNASKLTRLNFKGSTAELAKTVLNANRLGLSLTQVENIGGSLLDFESSIAAEMEAELITGRELNLEKARTFALNNDIAGLTQEIAKQGITAEKFSGMNRIAQEAIAKSLGMQASELADSLYKAKLIRETGGGYTDELRRQADQQERNNNLQEAEDLRKRASLIEQGLLSGQNLEDAKLAVSAQDKFNQLLLRVQEIFTDLIDGGTVDRFVEYIERVVKFFEGGGTILGLMMGNVPNRYTYEAQGETFSSPINAEDFTIKTHPKDTLVMAGGTKLGEGGNSNDEVVSLLKELVNRNGDVYLDGQKVGNALSSNYRTMSN